MITGFDIYLLTRLDYFSALFLIMMVCGLVAIGILGIKTFIDLDFDDEVKGQIKAMKIIAPITVLATLLFCLTPRTKEAAAIYLIPKIANNEQMQQIPENVAKLLNAKLQDWIKQFDDVKK